MALNATDVPVTGSSTIELELTTIILQVVITVAVSVGGGTLLGYYMSERSQTKQEKITLEKTKELLKHDFERVTQLVISDVKTNLESMKKLGEIESVKKLHQDFLKVTDFILVNYGIYEFNFWDAINSSGNLIKLELKEILIIEALHNGLEKYSSSLKNSHDRDYQYFESILVNKKQQISVDDFQKILKNRLGGVLNFHMSIYKNLQKMEIKWVNLEKLPQSYIDEANDEINKFRDNFTQNDKGNT